jgi:hypothetical protein
MSEGRGDEEQKTSINVFIRTRPLRHQSSCIDTIDKDERTINRIPGFTQ